MEYIERSYRSLIDNDLQKFTVKIKDTDLHISAGTRGKGKVIQTDLREYLFECRQELEAYLQKDPCFQESLEPYFPKYPDQAPELALQMAQASWQAGVGPMAAVAGAFAQKAGDFLSKYTQEYIVENGGDIVIGSQQERRIAIFAGESKLSWKIGLLVRKEQFPLAICTSSGKVGPSISFGQADAAVIVAKSALVADAFATATGNVIKSPADFSKALAFLEKTQEIQGGVFIVGNQMAIKGDLEIIPIK